MLKPKTEVKLPFEGRGIIKEVHERIWGSFYVIKITKGNAFYLKGDIETFLEKHITLDNQKDEL